MATSPILRPVHKTLRRPRTGTRQTSLTLFPIAARHGNCESPSGASAPPLVPDQSVKPAKELVGIARLAASSPCAEAKRGTEYFLLPVKSILNQCNSERVPFRWTVNPYRGCEFGCRYCYARYTHEYMELDGAEFETKIYVKQNAGALAERDLSREKIWGEHIAIGTATDPYQPAEREFGATRAILERMVEREGLSVSITTKSDQVVRDIDLLRHISERSSLTIHMTVTTVRTRLARMLEPREPGPDLRLAAIGKLRAQGIAANVVFLMPASLKSFMAFLEKEFPKLSQQYLDWFGRHGSAPESYRREIAERVERLRQKYGLGSRPRKPETQAWRSPQLHLAPAN